jgi:hypothetical protein
VKAPAAVLQQNAVEGYLLR